MSSYLQLSPDLDCHGNTSMFSSVASNCQVETTSAFIVACYITFDFFNFFQVTFNYLNTFLHKQMRLGIKKDLFSNLFVESGRVSKLGARVLYFARIQHVIRARCPVLVVSKGRNYNFHGCVAVAVVFVGDGATTTSLEIYWLQTLLVWYLCFGGTCVTPHDLTAHV